jgi:hypothetical protein
VHHSIFAHPTSATGQVMPFGNRSVNGSKGSIAEAQAPSREVRYRREGADSSEST